MPPAEVFLNMRRGGLILAAVGFDVLQGHVPRKEDPRVLADFGDECINLWPALWFGVDCREMRVWIKLTHQFQRFAAVDQIVDDQNTGAIAH